MTITTTKLTSDQILDNLLSLGETGTYKVENGSLYTQEHENSSFLFCGEVESLEEVDEIFSSIVADLFTDSQQEGVEAQAKIDAQLFFDEFAAPLDPEATDWDGTAYEDIKNNVPSLRGASQDCINALWPIYQGTLIAEVERLANEE